MKTFAPNPPAESKSGRWMTTTSNPSEDHWLINTDYFLGDNQENRGSDWHRANHWLAERLLFSTLLGASLPNGYEAAEAQLTIRPCDNGIPLRKKIQLVHFYSYSSLYLEKVSNTDDLNRAHDRLARELLDQLHFALLSIEDDYRPQSCILSYDDDGGAVHDASEDPEKVELYHEYCESKGLLI